jgi:hypothetical protein
VDAGPPVVDAAAPAKDGTLPGADGASPTADGSPTLKKGLALVADDGYRVAGSIPRAGLTEQGAVYLYYNGPPSTPGSLVAIAPDTLTFGAPAVEKTHEYDPRRTELPDGNWRMYVTKKDSAVLVSQYSTDGVTFAEEAGARYSGHASDNGTIGITDAYADEKGGVILLYIGDMMGKNNVRRAYSADNGQSFTFEDDNVFGDLNAGGGGKSYVDQFTGPLPDGSRRALVMSSGTIYSFTSQDGGKTYTKDNGIRLQPSSFPQFKVVSLHDPSFVILPDGRHRIYVCGKLEGNTEYIFSATSTD